MAAMGPLRALLRSLPSALARARVSAVAAALLLAAVAAVLRRLARASGALPACGSGRRSGGQRGWQPGGQPGGQSGGRGRLADSSRRCAVCQEGISSWATLVRARLRGAGAEAPVDCHLSCVCGLLGGGQEQGRWRPTGRVRSAEDLDEGFLRELQEALAMSPSLKHRWATLGIRHDDARLELAAGRWPSGERLELAAPPRAAFAFEGLRDIRIGSCPALTSLPPEIGLCRTCTTLAVMSCSLEAIPEEVSHIDGLERLFLNGNFLRSLPPEVGALPALEQLCVDANLLRTLPALLSPKLNLITAPCNNLTEFHAPEGHELARVELHGNKIPALRLPAGGWSGVDCLKLMGNDLAELPPEIAGMRGLRLLSVSDNRLRALPDLSRLPRLEKVYAYSNALAELPAGMLLGSKSLEIVLLEGNPLGGEALASLFEEARRSSLKTLSLDVPQARAWAAHDPVGALPSCASIGDLLPTGSPEGYYLKLMHSRQLRRQRDAERARHWEKGTPLHSPARMLVVAFAASQGEPEWLGLLRRILADAGGAEGEVPNCCDMLPEPQEPLGEWLRANAAGAAGGMAALWRGCAAGAPQAATAGERELPDDVDILVVVDHRMRWYAEDAPALRRVLADLVSKRERAVFIGASMGGFGALLHGGELADAVLAFGPQSRLDQAILRPAAATPGRLDELTCAVQDAVRLGRRRGARLEVHCAADEHFWHGLNLPLEDGALTVHPICPRKPFGRLLDSGGVLAPIVADALCRAAARPRAASAPAASTAAPALAAAAPAAVPPDAPSELLLALWGAGGLAARLRTPRAEVLGFFFGGEAAEVPRPGDWFCPRCSRRNMGTRFFCGCTGEPAADASVAAPGVPRVPGGRSYPQGGDWGCGGCGSALFGYQHTCPKCKVGKDGHRCSVVVGRREYR